MPPAKRIYKQRVSRDLLAGRERVLLDNLTKIAIDGLATASFADLEDGVATMPSGVAPVMKRLIARGMVAIVARPGGRAKTTYRIEGAEKATVTPLHLVETPPMKAQPEPTESCALCHFGKALRIGTMVCRRYPPSSGRFPTVTADDWCGEWQAG